MIIAVTGKTDRRLVRLTFSAVGEKNGGEYMASKRLKKKKQAAGSLQRHQEPEKYMTKETGKPAAEPERKVQEPLGEKPEVQEEKTVNAEEGPAPECETQGVCFQIEADLQQEEMEEMKAMNFYIQWNGREFCQADIVEQIRKQWEAMGNAPESLEKLNIYLKPEESKAYYVANDSVQGCVEL